MANSATSSSAPAIAMEPSPRPPTRPLGLWSRASLPLVLQDELARRPQDKSTTFRPKF